MESVGNTIERIRSWFYRQMDFLKNYPSENHRMIIMLSLIDAFAQDNSGFSRKNKKAFVDFLQTYSLQYNDILTAICPVTLFYSLSDKCNELCLQLRKGKIYSADSQYANAEAFRLLEEIPDKERESAKMKHSYAGLVYQLRNKLAHECTSLNMPLNFQYDTDEQLPHMACKNRIENGSLVFHQWALHIPEKFVKNVAVDAVEHYLMDCASRDYAPYSNLDRKCYNSWYD